MVDLGYSKNTSYQGIWRSSETVLVWLEITPNQVSLLHSIVSNCSTAINKIEGNLVRTRPCMKI